LHASLTDKTDASKLYIALVRGDWSNLPQTTLVNRPLTDDGVSREAQTEFHCLAYMKSPSTPQEANSTTTVTATENKNDTVYQGACSLVACRLLTGHKHQIRRHAFAIGHPIIGDSEHGSSKVNRWWRENRNLDRLFLHCLALDLPPMKRPQDSTTTHDDTVEDDNKNEINKDEEDKDDQGIVAAAAASVSPADDSIIADNSPMVSTESAAGTNNHNGDSDPPARIQCVAPLPPELSAVLHLDEMRDLWKVAVEKEPRLALEPYDEKGWTTGREATVKENMILEPTDQIAQGTEDS
jgi:RNA pseudouridylate synthase